MARFDICKKNKDGEKEHVFVQKTDGQGRELEYCEKCGTCLVNGYSLQLKKQK